MIELLTRIPIRSLRLLLRRPAFLVLATLTLSVAIAFAGTVVAVVDAYRHPTTPVRDVDEVFEVGFLGGGRGNQRMTGMDLVAAVQRTGLVDAVASARVWAPVIGVGDDRKRQAIQVVSPNYFDVLGVRPVSGRLFTSLDTLQRNAAIVSQSYWRSHFPAAEMSGGQTLRVDSAQVTIVGVVPDGTPNAAVDVWLLMSPQDRVRFSLLTIRLRREAHRSDAEAQLKSVAELLTRNEIGQGAGAYGVVLTSLRPSTRGLGAVQKVLLIVAFGTLFVAGANLAALMLARLAVRTRDLSLHLALGASSRVLFAEQFCEAAILSIIGAAGGLLLASWAQPGIARAIPDDVRSVMGLAPNWPEGLLRSIVVVLAVTVLFVGVIPGWRAARTPPMRALKHVSGEGARHLSRYMNFVVATEAAVALVLLVGAHLLVTSAQRARAFDFGFDTRQLVVASGEIVYRQDLDRLHDAQPGPAMRNVVASVPGVLRAAAYSYAEPAHHQVSPDIGGSTNGVLLVGRYITIGARFFETTGIRLIRGRDISDGDETEGAVVLDERAASALFPNADPIGRRVKLGPRDGVQPWLRVVGIAREAKLAFSGVSDVHSNPTIYVGTRLSGRQWKVVARVSGDVVGASVRIKQALLSALPERVEANVEPLGAPFARYIRLVRFNAAVFAVLSAVALLLVCTGLLAVVSYLTSYRRHEFALRVALGARPMHLFRLVMRDSVEIALGGACMGELVVVGRFGVGQILEPVLFHVEPDQPSSLILAIIAVVASALVVSLAPALAAAQSDGTNALHAD